MTLPQSYGKLFCVQHNGRRYRQGAPTFAPATIAPDFILSDFVLDVGLGLGL